MAGTFFSEAAKTSGSSLICFRPDYCLKLILLNFDLLLSRLNEFLYSELCSEMCSKFLVNGVFNTAGFASVICSTSAAYSGPSVGLSLERNDLGFSCIFLRYPS